MIQILDCETTADSTDTALNTIPEIISPIIPNEEISIDHATNKTVLTSEATEAEDPSSIESFSVTSEIHCQVNTQQLPILDATDRNDIVVPVPPVVSSARPSRRQRIRNVANRFINRISCLRSRTRDE